MLEPPREWQPLRADCSRCAGLCCVVPEFAASSDFAITKPARTPCPNLGPDFRCGIHTRLRATGFTGCTVYDCFGAGQHVTQVVFDGRDWTDPEVAGRLFEVFPVVRTLHEVLNYLVEAAARLPEGGLRAEVVEARADLEALLSQGPDVLRRTNPEARRREVNTLLLRASESLRAPASRRPDHRGADLIGRSFAGADLRGASLRGALLIGADLRRADLRGADLIGADLRGADLRGTDLRDTLFLVQSQLDAAKGDHTTTLSPPLAHSQHWPTNPTRG
ncbi:pentapeptide repeat-containing protein [Actinosynnema sp.]|uniref:pentapeptide repeat-containing protein n=1 Tax=Actinosynnema sp. TaxID=1872144 RepID=UPI003F841602